MLLLIELIELGVTKITVKIISKGLQNVVYHLNSCLLLIIVRQCKIIESALIRHKLGWGGIGKLLGPQLLHL